MNKSNEDPRANVIEIFSSIQGEGLFAGQMHRFVRFSGCNLKCCYCDTPESRDPDEGRPFSVDGLLKEIAGGAACPGRMLCLTGGEPLLQADFIKEVLVSNRRNTEFYLPVLLETNGTLPDELEKVVPYVDFISMDIKLLGEAGTSGTSFETSKTFLKISYIKRAYVKVVVTSNSDLSEFDKAVGLVATIDPGIPFYIQPVTSCDKMTVSPRSEALLDLYHAACKKLNDVYIMPQIHKIIGLK